MYKGLGYDDETFGLMWMFVFYPLVGILLFINLFFVSEEEKMNPGFFLLFIVLITIILIKEAICTYRRHKHYIMIKEKGIKIPATINKCVESEKGICLVVSYFDPNENVLVEYKTVELGFDPGVYLGSRACNIYLYDSEKYVSDFVKVKKGESSILNGNMEKEGVE